MLETHDHVRGGEESVQGKEGARDRNCNGHQIPVCLRINLMGDGCGYGRNSISAAKDEDTRTNLIRS